MMEDKGGGGVSSMIIVKLSVQIIDRIGGLACNGGSYLLSSW